MLVWEWEEVQEVPRDVGGCPERRSGYGGRLARGLLGTCLLAVLVPCVLSVSAVASTQTCPPSQPTLPTSSLSAAELVSPERTVVCVGVLAIEQSSYSHWLVVAEHSLGPGRRPSGKQLAASLRNEVLGFLISADWVRGEASARNIEVSKLEVTRRFDRIRGQQFPKRREFSRFLLRSGQTVGDLLFRVEQDLLSARIEQAVVAGQHNAAARRQAFASFVKSFRVKWSAQTYCVPEYTEVDCGHVQSVL
jgi:hypothetical protein